MYFIIAIITAIIILTLMLAFNKSRQNKSVKLDMFVLIFATLICGILWPITLFIVIFWIVYKLFIKEYYDKFVEWLSNKLFS